MCCLITVSICHCVLFFNWLAEILYIFWALTFYKVYVTNIPKFITCIIFWCIIFKILVYQGSSHPISHLLELWLLSDLGGGSQLQNHILRVCCFQALLIPHVTAQVPQKVESCISFKILMQHISTFWFKVYTLGSRNLISPIFPSYLFACDLCWKAFCWGYGVR